MNIKHHHVCLPGYIASPNIHEHAKSRPNPTPSSFIRPSLKPSGRYVRTPGFHHSLDCLRKVDKEYVKGKGKRERERKKKHQMPQDG